MAGLLSVQSTVGNWFVAKRGRAMTLTMTIAGLGAIIVPFVASRLVVLFDGAWQSGWYLVVFMGVVLVPLALLFIKNTPAEIGQQPDGAPLGAQEAEEAGADKGAGAQRVYKNRGSVRFADAVRSAPFWLISLVGTGGFVAYTLAVSQGVIHFTSLGFEQGSIVNAVVSMGFASLLGRLVIGMQSDRIEPVRLMSVALFIAAAGILQAAFASHPAMVFIYYLTTGFGFGAVSTLLPTTIANYFGAGEFAKQLGTTMLITTLVASTLPVFSGFVFDTTGLCVVAFLVTAGIVVLCALCGFLVRFPQEKGGG
jgi:MFS family permease